MTLPAQHHNVIPIHTPNLPNTNQASDSRSTSHQPRLARGVALDCTETGWLVQFEGIRRSCSRATSCLVEPAPGDDLLLALDDDGADYILAVLARSGQEPLALELEGDATIASSGVLRIAATEGLELFSHKKARLVAKGVEVSAAAADLAVKQVNAVGTRLQNHFDTIRSIAQQLDTVADRVIERAKSRYQFVEEGDHLRAAQVDIRAEKVMSLQGQQTLVTAQEVVTIDGAQVHVG